MYIYVRPFICIYTKRERKIEMDSIDRKRQREANRETQRERDRGNMTTNMVTIYNIVPL